MKDEQESKTEGRRKGVGGKEDKHLDLTYLRGVRDGWRSRAGGREAREAAASSS